MTIDMTVVILYRRFNLMKTISKSKLKAKMLEIFRQIESSGNEMIVTDTANRS
jgi:hypothetical protein